MLMKLLTTFDHSLYSKHSFLADVFSSLFIHSVCTMESVPHFPFGFLAVWGQKKKVNPTNLTMCNLAVSVRLILDSQQFCFQGKKLQRGSLCFILFKHPKRLS